MYEANKVRGDASEFERSTALFGTQNPPDSIDSRAIELSFYTFAENLSHGSTIAKCLYR